MEVEIPRRALTLTLLALVVASLVTLGWLGWANSPRGSDGRPLLLTPERRAIRRYLQSAAGWAMRLEEVGETLDRLTPPSLGVQEETRTPPDTLTLSDTLTLTGVLTVELPPAVTLPAPATPVALSADLYRRVQEAQKAREALLDIGRQVERTAVPDALAGLRDTFIVPALGAHVAWCDAVLVYAGAPDAVEPGQLTSLQAQAHAALEALNQALRH